MKNNIGVGGSIRRKDREDVVVKSIIWNSIIAVFKNEKDIDITSYLVSINLRGNTVFIKTSKPIINTEALMLDDKIKKVSQEKLLKIGIKILNLKIKYL